LNDPLKSSEYRTAIGGMEMGTVSGVLERAFPELPTPLQNIVVDDLVSSGLIAGNLRMAMSGSGLNGPFSTERGKAFVGFITRIP
jgi:hypothetical protein